MQKRDPITLAGWCQQIEAQERYAMCLEQNGEAVSAQHAREGAQWLRRKATKEGFHVA